MRAFVFDKYKQPVHEADIPEPTVGDRDVLIRVEAAGLNHLDERLRAGEFKAILPYKTPVTLGHDVAGTVIRTGAGVTRFTAGATRITWPGSAPLARTQPTQFRRLSGGTAG